MLSLPKAPLDKEIVTWGSEDTINGILATLALLNA